MGQEDKPERVFPEGYDNLEEELAATIEKLEALNAQIAEPASSSGLQPQPDAPDHMPRPTPAPTPIPKTVPGLPRLRHPYVRQTREQHIIFIRVEKQKVREKANLKFEAIIRPLDYSEKQMLREKFNQKLDQYFPEQKEPVKQVAPFGERLRHPELPAAQELSIGFKENKKDMGLEPPPTDFQLNRQDITDIEPDMD